MSKDTKLFGQVQAAWTWRQTFERFSKDVRVVTVEEWTLETVALLRGKGFEVTFEMNPGTHFAPMYPRLEKALAAMI